MKRRAASLAVSLWLAGCGISLDVDPRSPEPAARAADAGARDAGARRRDAAVEAVDAATEDAGGTDLDAGGSRMDAASGSGDAGALESGTPPPRDASAAFDASTAAGDAAPMREAGIFEAGALDGALRVDGSAGVTVCGPTLPCASPIMVCQATIVGSCGVGTCVPRLPCGVTTMEPGICGCNGTLYDTRALASCSGSDVRAPPATCCFTDVDCGGVGRCVGADCAGGHAGTCRVTAGSGGCWDSFDCAATEVCTAAPCNCASCPPMPGTCRAG